MASSSYSVGDVEVAFTDILPPENEEGKWHYRGLRDGKATLKKGEQVLEGSLPLPCDMIVERDVPVTLRDGVRIRVDVHRPVASQPVPAVICYSPYGKGGSGFHSELVFLKALFRVSKNSKELILRPSPNEAMLSSMSINEAFGTAKVFRTTPEPKDHNDTRAGDFVWEGSQEGRDGYDVVEWVAAQDWCSGKTGMAGNSWLVQSMWHIAAERPPHLTAIAPWEGHSDFYRETWCRGGVPTGGFWEFLSSWLRGRGKKEDVRAMLDKYPLVNEYWEDKCAKLDRINIPAYILASYSTGLHTYGSVRGFREIDCDEKWLRFHPYQEWYDLYQPESTQDLLKFFDCYLKGEENGWKETPRVRLSLLSMGDTKPVRNQPENEYPLARTKYTKLYLNTTNSTLSDSPTPESSQVVSYYAESSDAKHRAGFTYTFKEKTQLAGYSKLHVYVSCKERDDLDIFVQIRKLDKNGEEMCQINYPMETLREMAGVKSEADVPWFNIVRHLGPTGVLRASHRALDPKRATDFDPVHPSTHEEKIPPGEVVAIDIGFWPCGLVFEAGESLKLVVAGHALQLKEFPEVVERNFNIGTHNLHGGGRYESFLQVPVI